MGVRSMRQPSSPPALVRLSRRRRARVVVAIFNVFTLLGGFGVLYLRSLDKATPVLVGEAVDQFREAQATPSGPASDGSTITASVPT